MNITSIAGVNTMKKKSSQGRKKIEIKKIEEGNNRQVTFSKRRNGLFKKAAELCVLTGAHIAILVHSPGNKVYTFGHHTVDNLIDRFLNNASTSDTSTTDNRENRHLEKDFNEHYVEVSKELELEKKRRGVIEETKIIKGCDLPWYNEGVDDFEVEELQLYLSSLVELKRKVLVRADELMMIKKAPAMLGPNMLSIGPANDVIPTMEIPGNATASSEFGFAHSHGREWMM